MGVKLRAGTKIGKYTVCDITPVYKNRNHYVLCKCKCGIVKLVKSTDLKSKKSTQCIKCAKVAQFRGYGELSGKYFGNIKYDAHRRNIIFNVSKKYLWNLYIQQNKKCALSNLPIEFNNTLTKATASLDRIDSSRGYVKGNVQWVHKHVNFMKCSYDELYFIDMCEKIVINFKKKRTNAKNKDRRRTKRN